MRLFVLTIGLSLIVGQASAEEYTCGMLRVAWMFFPNTVRERVLEKGVVKDQNIDIYINRILYYCQTNTLDRAELYALNDIEKFNR